MKAVPSARATITIITQTANHAPRLMSINRHHIDQTRPQVTLISFTSSSLSA
jgi:hypothetical protein